MMLCSGDVLMMDSMIIKVLMIIFRIISNVELSCCSSNSSSNFDDNFAMIIMIIK